MLFGECRREYIGLASSILARSDKNFGAELSAILSPKLFSPFDFQFVKDFVFGRAVRPDFFLGVFKFKIVFLIGVF